MSFTARYPGRCANTGAPIRPGDTVRSVARGRYALVSRAEPIDPDLALAACGGGICSVNGSYKGLPVSSKGMGVREATAAARVAVASLVHRTGGPDEWNARLEAARKAYADVSAA